MKNLFFALLAIFLLAHTVASAKAFDLAGQFKNYTCMKNSGFDHAIIRSYHSYGAIDVDAADNIRLSNLAGLSTDNYMFPCRGKNATAQVNELIAYLNNISASGVDSRYQGNSGTIWLDIETNPSSGCSWSQGNPDSNCQFIKQLITAIEAKGRAVGIYASAYMWNEIFGSKSVCTIFSSYPLWYAHYDGKQDFSDYATNPFGGWTKPTIKQYAGDSPVCGYKVDLSFY